MNINIPIEKLEKTRAMTDSFVKKVWKLRNNRAMPEVSLISDALLIKKFVDEVHESYLAEQEHQAQIQEGMGIEPLDQQDHDCIGF